MPGEAPEGRREFFLAAVRRWVAEGLNADLAPVPKSRRVWTTYNYAALWISMAHCIPTYMLAGGLIAVGMNWWQALLRGRSKSCSPTVRRSSFVATRSHGRDGGFVSPCTRVKVSCSTRSATRTRAACGRSSVRCGRIRGDGAQGLSAGGRTARACPRHVDRCRHGDRYRVAEPAAECDRRIRARRWRAVDALGRPHERRAARSRARVRLVHQLREL